MGYITTSNEPIIILRKNSIQKPIEKLYRFWKKRITRRIDGIMGIKY